MVKTYADLITEENTRIPGLNNTRRKDGNKQKKKRKKNKR